MFIDVRMFTDAPRRGAMFEIEYGQIGRFDIAPRWGADRGALETINIALRWSAEAAREMSKLEAPAQRAYDGGRSIIEIGSERRSLSAHQLGGVTAEQ